MTEGRTTPTGSGLDHLIDRAKDDLALRSNTPVSAILLVEASPVVWPDSSFGCPQPGMSYLQVPADGARIVLEVDGERFDYHYGGRRGLFLCERRR